MAGKLQETQNKVLLPLYTVENETTSEGISASAYGELYSGRGQALYNCWAEVRKDPVGGESEVWVQKRTGINTCLDDADLNTNWEAVFDDWNGGAQPTYVDFRVPKDFLNLSIIDDWMVAAVIHASSAAVEQAATLKIIFFKPSDGSIVAHEITSYSWNGATVNTSFYGNAQVHLNEFAGGYAPGSGTASAITAYVTIVFTTANKDASAAFYCSYTGGTWTAPTQITSIDFATHYGGAPWTNRKVLAGNFAMLNGRAFIMTQDGYIWGSNIGDITTGSGWADVTGAPMFENAISYPDKGVGLIRYKHHILAFGRQSLEFFSDVGAEQGLPIESTNEAFVKFGAVNPYAIVNLEDTVYWIGMSAESGMNGIWRMEGYQPVRVSNPEFENIFRAASNNDYSDYVYEHLSILPLEMGGRLHLALYMGWQYNLPDPIAMMANAQSSSLEGEQFFFGTEDADYYTGVGRRPSYKPFQTSTSLLCFNSNDRTQWYLNHRNLFNWGTLSVGRPLRAVNLTTKDTQAVSRPVTGGRRQYVIDAAGASVWRVADDRLTTFATDTSSDLRFMDNDDDGAEPASRFDFFPMFIVSPIIDFGTNDRKFCARASLLGTRMYPITGWNFKGVATGDSGLPENYLVLPYTGTLDTWEEMRQFLDSFYNLDYTSAQRTDIGSLAPWYTSEYTSDFMGTGLPFAGDAHPTALALAWSDNEIAPGSEMSERGVGKSNSVWEESDTNPYALTADDMLKRVTWGGLRCKNINPWRNPNYTFNGLGSFRRRQFFWGIQCMGDFRAHAMELFISQGTR